jgi:hypothetical protein
MSLLGRIGKFVRTPQGKKLVKQSQDLARDPETKQKIDEARDRLAHRDDAQPKTGAGS